MDRIRYNMVQSKIATGQSKAATASPSFLALVEELCRVGHEIVALKAGSAKSAARSALVGCTAEPRKTITEPDVRGSWSAIRLVLGRIWTPLPFDPELVDLAS
jgi:hypothetical protein